MEKIDQDPERTKYDARRTAFWESPRQLVAGATAKALSAVQRKTASRRRSNTSNVRRPKSAIESKVKRNSRSISPETRLEAKPRRSKSVSRSKKRNEELDMLLQSETDPMARKYIIVHRHVLQLKEEMEETCFKLSKINFSDPTEETSLLEEEKEEEEAILKEPVYQEIIYIQGGGSGKFYKYDLKGKSLGGRIRDWIRCYFVPKEEMESDFPFLRGLTTKTHHFIQGLQAGLSLKAFYELVGHQDVVENSLFYHFARANYLLISLCLLGSLLFPCDHTAETLPNTCLRNKRKLLAYVYFAALVFTLICDDVGYGMFHKVGKQEHRIQIWRSLSLVRSCLCICAWIVSCCL